MSDFMVGNLSSIYTLTFVYLLKKNIRILRNRVRSIIRWWLRGHHKHSVFTLLGFIQLQQSCIF